MMRYLIVAGAALAVCAACWGHGYRQGGNAAQARSEAAVRAVEADLAQVSEAGRQAAAQLLAQRTALETLRKAADDEARADPGACRPSDPVRLRLGRRWGAAPAAP